MRIHHWWIQNAINLRIYSHNKDDLNIDRKSLSKVERHKFKWTEVKLKNPSLSSSKRTFLHKVDSEWRIIFSRDIGVKDGSNYTHQNLRLRQKDLNFFTYLYQSCFLVEFIFDLTSLSYFNHLQHCSKKFIKEILLSNF